MYFSLFQKIVSEARTSPSEMVQKAKIGILVALAVLMCLHIKIVRSCHLKAIGGVPGQNFGFM